jgi:DNA-binding MarR family transcriptional regulator
VDLEAHRELKLLESIESSDTTTQRGLADQLGIALGLANLYVKRLARKGYIKCVNVRPNRVRYLLTPKGVAEKTRLTYEFMEYSLVLMRQTRRHLKAMLEPYLRQPDVRVAIFGDGEAAELAYLCLRELGLDPVAVLYWHAEGTMLGTPILAVDAHASVPFDVLIVAAFEDPSSTVAALSKAGVAREKLVTLRNPIVSTA